MPAVPPADPPSRPLLSVVRGVPTPAELAAVVVVLAARAAAQTAGPATPQPRSQWAARERLMRPPLSAGPGAWRASALPR